MKRDLVFDKDGVWVETTAKDVIGFGCEEKNIIQFEMKVQKALMDKMARLENENKNSYFQKWLRMLQKPSSYNTTQFMICYSPPFFHR